MQALRLTWFPRNHKRPCKLHLTFLLLFNLKGAFPLSLSIPILSAAASVLPYTDARLRQRV